MMSLSVAIFIDVVRRAFKSFLIISSEASLSTLFVLAYGTGSGLGAGDLAIFYLEATIYTLNNLLHCVHAT